jgi:hypothetical protein
MRFVARQTSNPNGRCSNTTRPFNGFVRASETLWQAPIVREVVHDGPDCELALHVKGGLEFALRQQESIDAPQPPAFDIDEQTGAAFAAGEARIPLQFPRRWIAADHADGISGIDRLRRVGAPVYCLTVVAMAVKLHDGLTSDFDLDRSAAALDFDHSFCSRRFLLGGSVSQTAVLAKYLAEPSVALCATTRFGKRNAPSSERREP